MIVFVLFWLYHILYWSYWNLFGVNLSLAENITIRLQHITCVFPKEILCVTSTSCYIPLVPLHASIAHFGGIYRGQVRVWFVMGLVTKV